MHVMLTFPIHMITQIMLIKFLNREHKMKSVELFLIDNNIFAKSNKGEMISVYNTAIWLPGDKLPDFDPKKVEKLKTRNGKFEIRADAINFPKVYKMVTQSYNYKTILFFSENCGIVLDAKIDHDIGSYSESWIECTDEKCWEQTSYTWDVESMVKKSTQPRVNTFSSEVILPCVEPTEIQFPCFAKSSLGAIGLFRSQTSGCVVHSTNINSIGIGLGLSTPLSENTEWEILPKGTKIILTN